MGFAGMRLGLLAGLLLGAAGCALPLSVSQCQKDSDCPKVGDSQLTCTPDHLCVVGTAAQALVQVLPLVQHVGHCARAAGEADVFLAVGHLCQRARQGAAGVEQPDDVAISLPPPFAADLLG